MFYGNTWVRDSPYYYNNFDFADWGFIVQDPSLALHLKELLDDLYGKPIVFIDNIIKKKINEYFVNKKLISIDSLKSNSIFLDQIKILTALDFYSNKVLWTNNNFYFAEDERFTFPDFKFFETERLLYNISRYIGDGYNNRVIVMMTNILSDSNKISRILQDINSQTSTALSVQPS